MEKTQRDPVLVALDEVLRRFKDERPGDRISKATLSERVLGKDRSTVSKWFSGTPYSSHDIARICDHINRLAPGWAEPIEAALAGAGQGRSTRFGDMWSALIGGKDLTIIEAAEIRGKPHTGAPRALHSEERNLVHQLRDALREDRRTARVRTRMKVSDPLRPDVEDALYTDDTFLVGGPATNFQVRNFLNFIPHLRWEIRYDMPGFQNARVLDRSEMNVRYASYDKDGFPTTQWGVLTVVRNPAREQLTIVSAAGIHSEMTSAIVKLLLDGDLRLGEGHAVELPIPRNARGFQVLFAFEGVSPAALDDVDELVKSLRSFVYQVPHKDPLFFPKAKKDPAA